MYSFERFVARGNINLEKFFKEIKVSSDEELMKYCAEKNLTPPKKKYFPQEVPRGEAEKLLEETGIHPEVENQEVSIENPEVKPRKTTRAKTTRRRTKKKEES